MADWPGGSTPVAIPMRRISPVSSPGPTETWAANSHPVLILYMRRAMVRACVKGCRMSELSPKTNRLVLVADDNDEPAFVIESMLDLLDFAVERARDGREALEMSAN